MYIHCLLKDGALLIFLSLGKRGFYSNENFIAEKCLLILDKISSYIFDDALCFLEKNKISYVFIPPGMTL